MTSLPIHSVLPDLLHALRVRTEAVLEAPPGAGKTTVVPLALLGEEWLGNKRLIMLEPRRLAARGAAWRMAELLGEEAGQRIGYRMRGETRTSAATRIEVVTEGILTRMLQSDPTLENIGGIIFDEFHERSLHADLGLALALQSRELFRDDLRILVMSATLDGKPIARLLNDAPVITGSGRTYPVETVYVGNDGSRLEEQTARAVARALREEKEGDILVFLPGFGEIRRTEEQLRPVTTDRTIRVLPLHGSLRREEQDRAIQPSPPGIRKVVLATSIAETSLTIEGVRIVIDAGLSRIPRYSPRTGMTRLETVRSPLASADQRRGRAGRLGPGRCYRLWNAAEDAALLPGISPEILEADLSSLALDLARWGAAPEELRWLTPPPVGAFAAAQELLQELDALDDSGTITAEGERMSRLPVHPRLAHMLLRAESDGNGEFACVLASLIEERDIVRGEQARRDPDLHLRLDILRRYASGGSRSLPPEADRHAVKRVMEGAERLSRMMEGQTSKTDFLSDGNFPDAERTGRLLAVAWPDRIAQRRTGNNTGHGQERTLYQLSNGQRAQLFATGHLSREEYLVIPSVGGSGQTGIIELAVPIALESLRELFKQHIRHSDVITWTGPEQGVSAEREELLGALTLTRNPLHNPDGEAVLNATLQGIREQGINVLPWTRELRELCDRITFLHRHHSPEWPDMGSGTLLGNLDDWLRPALETTGGRNRLKGFDLKGGLLGRLTWEQIRDLDTLAPERLAVPSGSNIRLDYSNPDDPVLPVRLQEMFGATDTPRIAGGRVPVTLHLLSPAQRPMQVTRDLAGFWERTYAEVRKELKGRYPKHYWPDDPLQAEPTRRTKRSGQ